MDKPCVEKIGLPFFDGNFVQNVRQRLICNAGTDFLLRYRLFESDVDIRIRFAIHDVP